MSDPQAQPSPEPNPPSPAAPDAVGTVGVLPKPPSSPMATLGILLAPAACCFVIGWIWGNSSGLNAAIALILIAIVGSLAAGICSGIRVARRFAGPNGTNVGVAIGLSLLCIGASAIACFGGCLAGLFNGR